MRQAALALRLAFCTALLALNSCSVPERIKVVIEPKFDEPVYREGLILARAGKTFGYFDHSGKCVIELTSKGFQEVWTFSEGLARVKKGGRYGFLDRTGNLAVEASWDVALPFSEGLAVVRKGERWGFIDKSGAVVIPLEYTSVWPFSDGLALVNIGGSVEARRIDSATGDATGYITAGGESGYIDRKGRMVIQSKCDWAFSFADGMARVNIGGKLSQYGDIQNGKWGFLNRSGQLVVPLQFDVASDFSEGLGAVRVGDGWSFVDRAGKMIVEPLFEEVCDFSGGLACVRTPLGYHYIGPSGRIAVQRSYAAAGDFVDGSAPASADGVRWGAINTKGEWVVQPAFVDVGFFSEGATVVRHASGSVAIGIRGHKCRYGGARYPRSRSSDESDFLRQGR